MINVMQLMPTKINKELGWAPSVTFEEGLSQNNRLVSGKPRMVGSRYFR